LSTVQAVRVERPARRLEVELQALIGSPEQERRLELPVRSCLGVALQVIVVAFQVTAAAHQA
jgi:hypothetical protein